MPSASYYNVIAFSFVILSNETSKYLLKKFGIGNNEYIISQNMGYTKKYLESPINQMWNGVKKYLMEAFRYLL